MNRMKSFAGASLSLIGGAILVLVCVNFNNTALAITTGTVAVCSTVYFVTKFIKAS
jgi:hypothetical protein